MTTRPGAAVPLTREDVERRVVAMFTHGADFVEEAHAWAQLGKRVAAAVLAMGECERCKGTGWLPVSSWRKVPEPCSECMNAGLNQARVAKGLAALRGAGT